MAERKIVLTVPIFELFRARSEVAIAAFKAGLVSSRPVGCWGTVSMAETVGSCKRAVWRRVLGGASDAPNIDGHSTYHGMSHTGRPIRRRGLHSQLWLSGKPMGDLSGFQALSWSGKIKFLRSPRGCMLRSIGYGVNTSIFLRELQCRCRTEATDDPYLI